MLSHIMNFVLILVIFFLTLSNTVKCEKTHLQIHKCYYPQLDTLVRYMATGFNTLCFVILCVLIILVIKKYNQILNTQHIKRKIFDMIPRSQRIIYVISLPEREEKYDSLNMIITKLLNTVKNGWRDEIIFDIDDSENIVKVIIEASQDKKDLLIYLDTAGGNLVNSDEICTALRIYQSVPKTNGSVHGSRVVCVVNNMAHSAGTMMALSADQISMSRFAVLGPTDPQVNVVHEKYDYRISCQLYNELDKIGKCDPSMYLVMRDRQNAYRDNINVFKTLKQYIIANNETKKKMINAFCSNSVPHHRGFTTEDLLQMGIRITPMSSQQKNILKLLENYKDGYLLSI